MNRLMLQLAFVVGSIVLGGFLGGLVGREVGRRSPSIVRAIAGDSPNSDPKLPADFRPDEFGLGLGALSGLFLGGGAGIVLVALATLREVAAAWREARSNRWKALAGGWD